MKNRILVIPILSLISSMSIEPARAVSFGWNDLKNAVVKVGDNLKKVIDVGNPNSDARRILRNLDITNPNSPACNTLRSGGSDIASSASTAGPKGMAVAAAITTAQKICGNAAKGQVIDKDQAEVDIAVMYQTQLAIEQARQNGETERVKILESSKIKLEELQQNGQTDRVRIVQENLLAMTLSNNQTQIALGEQNLKAVESNNWTSLRKIELEGGITLWGKGIDIAGDWIRGQQQTERDRINAENERLRIANEAKRIENERLKIEFDAKKQQQPQDSNLAMLQSWGLEVTSCAPATTYIYIDNRSYCTIPKGNFQASGQYIYNRITNKLKLFNENQESSTAPSPQGSRRFK